MEVGSSKRTRASSVVAQGSVWESRMKMDQVRGGIKVFNGEQHETEQTDEQTAPASPSSILTKLKKPTTNQNPGKRKTWKSEGVFDKTQIQISRAKTEHPLKSSNSTGEEKCNKEVSVKSPVQTIRKMRSDERSPPSVQVVRKSISEIGGKGFPESDDKGIETEIEKNLVQLSRKLKLESYDKKIVENNALQMVKSESEDSVLEIEKNPVQISTSTSSGSDESFSSCKEFGVCEEKVISDSVNGMSLVKSGQIMVIDDDDDDDDDEDEEDEEEELEIEVDEKKSLEIKKVEVNEVKKFHIVKENSVSSSITVKKQPPPTFPTRRHSTVYQNYSKPSTPSPDSSGCHKVQSLVDLIMWRDVSRSAFVFGIGTFIIISSSYAKDTNISFISVVSYLGLFYLASIFLYRSIVCRGGVDIDDRSCVVGEEEAIWLLKLFLPYFNELLLKLKALFCGDPATTMKLAAVLFVLARCGRSITIWKVAKWGFFGVFTVPKVCSSHSTLLTAFGKFWIRRFFDAWNSCLHKKGIAIAIFMLVWNLSSVVARIWAVFMLFVALRYYYQQSLVLNDDKWAQDDDGDKGGDNDTCRVPIRVGRRKPVRAAGFSNPVVLDNKERQKKKL